MRNDFDSAILDVTSHRPWPMPNAPWVMTQTWHELLFAHWAADLDVLAAKVPPEFAVDVFDGTAWIGIVPFYMTNVAARGLPAIPWLSEFPEVNVRTYVRVGDRPGIYFFSLDAGSSAAVLAARTLLNLPYYSAKMSVARKPTGVEYDSTRTDDPSAVLTATYAPVGDSFSAEKGSLEYFLTERYCLYNLDHRRRPYRLDIHHAPWLLQPARAELIQNTMGNPHGLSLTRQPTLLHFAKRQDMVAWAPEPVFR